MSLGNSYGNPSFGARPRRNLLMRYIARFDDGEIARAAFYGLLAGAIAVIGFDLKALYDERPFLDPTPTGGTVLVEPVLPPAVHRDGAERQQTFDPRDNVTGDREALRQPLRFELRQGGVMSAEGSIDLGAARRFAEEVEQRGEYVTTLSINSPGGSLDDAMDIARLVRARGMNVTVADGALCASSCPLILAGGAERSVDARAAVGLHQFYAATDLSSVGPAQAMSDAQATTARISRHLAEMGIDPAMWLHALDTPPQTLYYLSQEELQRYRLINSGQKLASR